MAISRFFSTALCMMLCFVSIANGDVVIGYEEGTASSLQYGVNIYTIGHSGRLPENWNDLQEILKLDEIDKGMQVTQSRSLYDLYAFVPQDVRLSQQERRDRILMVRTAPLQLTGRGGVGRYVVTFGDDGQVRGGFLKEEKIQAAFAAAKVEIPKLKESSSYGESEAGKATPSALPLDKQSTVLDRPTPTVVKQAQATSPLTEKPSSGMLILALIILAGLLAGALVFFLWRK